MSSILRESVRSCGRGVTRSELWGYWQEQVEQLAGDLDCLDPDDEEYRVTLGVYEAACEMRSQHAAPVVED